MNPKNTLTEHRRRELVSASELAQLGYCERVVHLDWKHGAKRSKEQVLAQDRGNQAHEQFYRDSVEVARVSQTKGKCFVATMALGECAETNALRGDLDFGAQSDSLNLGSTRVANRELAPLPCSECLAKLPRSLYVLSVQIDRSRRERRMPQVVAHRRQLSAARERMRCVCVPHPMRARAP